MRKVALLLLSYEDRGLYTNLESLIKQTWASIKNDNVKVWFYYGNNKTFEVSDNIIRCPFPENFNNIGHKTICAFEHLLTTDFDYLFRPNSSSFVNINKLSEMVQNLPKTKFYGGRPIHLKCASGCGYLLSRDLIELIVEKKNMWDHKIIDDMALCYFLEKQGIEFNEVPYIEVDEIKNNKLYSLGKEINDEEFIKYHHIRTHSPNMNRETNIKLMKLCFETYLRTT